LSLRVPESSIQVHSPISSINDQNSPNSPISSIIDQKSVKLPDLSIFSEFDENLQNPQISKKSPYFSIS
jgi:hypothetical protein